MVLKIVYVFSTLTLVVSSTVQLPSIDVDDKQLAKIVIDSEVTVHLSTHFNVSDDLRQTLIRFEFSVKSTEPETIQVAEIIGNSSLWIGIRGVENKNVNCSIVLKGLFPGFFNLEIKSFLKGENISESNVFKGSVVRKLGKIDFAFNIIIRVAIFITYTNMGCQLDLGVVKSTMKRPTGPMIGFLSQFIFMPCLSYVVGYLLLRDYAVWRLGIFLLGCSPGGNSSNFWTLLFHGDLNLSITMTFISTIAALGMMPLWVRLLGTTITDSQLRIPFVDLITSLVVLTSPLVLGILIKYFKPKWAEKSKKIIRPLTIVVVIFMITITVITQTFIFKMFTGLIVLTGFVIAFFGYLLGAISAWLFKLNKHQIIAISIETAFQNGSVTFLILRTTFGFPEADLAIVPVVAQLLITGQPLWLIYGVISLVSRIRRRKSIEPNYNRSNDENHNGCNLKENRKSKLSASNNTLEVEL